MSQKMCYQRRTYRNYSRTDGLVSFSVCVNESDLFISASRNLEEIATNSLINARMIIENYIKTHPEFLKALTPLPFEEFAPEIIKRMLTASGLCNVGPMASVAGAVAEYTAAELLKHAEEVIIENGGDIFLNTNRSVTVGIFAGTSPLSGHIGIKVTPAMQPVSICTSSGKVGHSLSFGSADAVTIKSASAPLSDAAATAIANIIKDKKDIPNGIEKAKAIPGITGVLIIKDSEMGIWGDMEIVRV